MFKNILFFLLVSLSLSSCVGRFPDPIEPTENKSRTIKNWIWDFSYDKVYGYPVSSFSSDLPICMLNPIKFPRNTWSRYDSNESSSGRQALFHFFMYPRSSRNKSLHYSITGRYKSQCMKSQEILKNQYLLFYNDAVIDEHEYQQLYQLYLNERSKVIATIEQVINDNANNQIKQQNIKRENDRNGKDVL